MGFGVKIDKLSLANIIKNQIRNQSMQFENAISQEMQIPWLDMFRLSKNRDIVFMIFGTIGAAAMGTAGTLCSFITGDMYDSFSTSDSAYDSAKTNMLSYIYLGIGAGLMAFVMFSTWMISGQRQIVECRKQYFRSILRQQIAWFDTQKQQEIAKNFSTDLLSFQLAIGQKFPTLIMLISMAISGLGMALYEGWILALVVTASTPFVFIFWEKYLKYKKQKKDVLGKKYTEADSRVQESLQSIKLMKQMNSQFFELENYSAKVKENNHFETIAKSLLYMFLSQTTFNLGIVLGYWYGSQCIFGTSLCPPELNNRTYTTGVSFKIFYGLFLPAVSLNQIIPCVQKIYYGKAAAARIFAIIDRQPLVKSKENAMKPSTFKGVFKFERVTFAYPKNKQVTILQDFDAVIDCKTSAMVGNSGCGKSTIFQLIMRYYDPDAGAVYLDGIDLKELDLEWLRDQIGYVQQQPFLFSGTLKQNMLLGKEDASNEQIIEALIKAEADEFAMEFKDGLNTFVGAGGSQMSGGQKQRIAIARALLKKPKVLLLDEATSALDRINEKQILNTLKAIAKDIITVSITHRSRVLADCDKVYHFKNKKVEFVAELKPETKLEERKSHEESELSNELIKKISKKMSSYSQPNTQLINGSPLLSPKKGRFSEQPRDIMSLQRIINTQAELNENIFKKIAEQEDEKYGLMAIFSYFKDKKLLFVLGITLCVLSGVAFPMMGVFIAQIMANQLFYPLDPNYYKAKVHTYILWCLGVAILGSVTKVLFRAFFYAFSDRFTKQKRVQFVGKMLKMPLQWFDREENQLSKFMNTFSNFFQVLSDFIELQTPFVTVIFSNIVFCIAGSIYFEWRSGLTSMTLIPLLVLSQGIQFIFIMGFNESNSKIFDQSSQFINQSIINIRTIFSLKGLSVIQGRFKKQLHEIHDTLIRKCLFSGVMYGVSYFLQYVTMGLFLFFSALYVSKYDVQTSDSFSAILLIFFACMEAGSLSVYLGDISKAKKAANFVFSFQQMEDEDQIQVKNGSKLLSTPIKGEIEFKNVSFEYKTRKEGVLKNVSFSIKQGEKVGLVGHSGCGKSTIFSLLLGFYSPQEGEILIDGTEIKDYDLHHLRASFGVVSQQPVLFNESVQSNIVYNLADVSAQQIAAAGVQANLKFFKENRENIENGRETDLGRALQPQRLKQEASSSHLRLIQNVGPKGSHVSGGQKQRIAIARAILRSPKILLLDEATSALDPENQAIVQKSLDQIMEGRTTISITHRYETIQNSNQILVLNYGKVVQEGTYRELCEKEGEFKQLLNGKSKI